MWETPVDNKVMEVPLRSLPGLDSSVLGFLIGLRFMYYFVF